MISMISEILREIKLSAEGEDPLGISNCYLRGHLFCFFFQRLLFLGPLVFYIVIS